MCATSGNALRACSFEAENNKKNADGGTFAATD